MVASRFPIATVAALSAAFVWAPPTAYSQRTEFFELVSDPPVSRDAFGASVAIHGDYVVVGAPYDRQDGIPIGAAYVFRRWGNTWVQQAKLVPPDGQWGDTFGQAVAIDGDWVVVGAPQIDIDFGDYFGAVYVFQRDGNSTPESWIDDQWVQVAKLTVPGLVEGDRLGLYVSIDNDVIAAGRPGFDTLGGVEVFRWNGLQWSHETTLTNVAAGTNRAFGYRVAVNGDAMVIGAPGRGPSPPPGAAFVYRRENGAWRQEVDLSALTSRPVNLAFGSSVAINADRAVVGRGWTSTYMFQCDGGMWSEERIFEPAGADITHSVGDAVALQQNVLTIGAPDDDDGANAAGAVYLFRTREGVWSQVAKLLATDPFFDAGLGDSLSVDDVYLAAGAFEHAYVFLISDEQVSLKDYADFQNCFTNGGEPLGPGCEPFDVGGVDGAVDAFDYDRFLRTFAGP